MLQDVRTRWNSTIMMLQHAIRLRFAIRDWIKKNSRYTHLYSTNEEWNQVEYIITVLASFYYYTAWVSTTVAVTLLFAFIIYNDLFNHLDITKERLEKKNQNWKKELAKKIDSAVKVLSKYYSAISEDSKELLYILALILHSSYKLKVFTKKEWQKEYNDDTDYWKKYEKLFFRFYKNHYDHLKERGLCHVKVDKMLAERVDMFCIFLLFLIISKMN